MELGLWLAGMVAGQPSWSDLPILLLTRPGADSSSVAWAASELGNVTLLERPVRVTALTSAVRSALRARMRQYVTRTHLIEREQADRRKTSSLRHSPMNCAIRWRRSAILSTCCVSRMLVGPPRRSATSGSTDHHMVRLVDDLMEVSRISRGKFELAQGNAGPRNGDRGGR